MRKTFSIFALGAMLLCGSAVLSAHHGMAAIFDVNDKITMTGTLVKVNWVNPHIGLGIEEKDASGKTVTWTMETSPPGWYTKDGIAKTDFEAALGKPVTVIFLKALDGSKYGYVERITFPNGVVGYSMNGIKDKDRK
jgi:hypothetical protein